MIGPGTFVASPVDNRMKLVLHDGPLYAVGTVLSVNIRNSWQLENHLQT